MPLNPGDRIERYVIDALIGQGGMGEVYRAHDARLRRSVALKVLRAVGNAETAGSSRSASTEGVARLLREARAAAALDHPNVVAVYDVGQVEGPEGDGVTYLAMELIAGTPLRARIGDPRVPLPEKLRWLSDVARALAAAHAAGIIHRDVKPENVMIRDDGRVKVLDFGIARRTADEPTGATTEGEGSSSLTGRGIVVGTPLYMAPEQLRAEALDGRADQFAWGVLAYELLTGKPPWATDVGSVALASQILSAPVPPLPRDAGIPAEVAGVVTRALSKDRATRFATMDALLVELGGGVNAFAETAAFAPVSSGSSLPAAGEPGSAPKIVVRERAPASSSRSLRGRATWPLVGGLIALSCVAILSGLEWRARRRQSATAASAAAAAGCTSNRACVEAHGGAPYLCRASDHACVAIESEDCKAMYEPRDLVADDTVWLGALFPTKGPRAEEFGTMNMDGVDFARSEIAQATSALRETTTSQHVRGIALVGCDDSVDVMRAARHLADDVGVPAILGFSSSQAVADVVEQVLVPHGALAISSITPNPTITHLPQPFEKPRLVWRTTYGYRALAEASAHFLHDTLEPRVARHATTRITLVRRNSIAAQAFADTLYKDLVLNEKAAIDSGKNYQEIVAASPRPWEALAERIAATSPTILVFLTPDAVTPELVERVESRSPRGGRPVYVIVDDGPDVLSPFVRADEERRRRVFGITSLSNSPANARFVIRYNQRATTPVKRTNDPGSSYDAFYLLAYGALALEADREATGRDIAEAFERLQPPGEPIELGPTSVLDALSTLRNGGRLDLEGTASGLDFDLSSGEVASEFALLCATTGEDEVESRGDLESGLVYRVASHLIEGTMRCP